MPAEQSSLSIGPVTPTGLNHLVLNVRDLEESHKFWTQILGFKMVGELHPKPERPNPPKMRFYSGEKNGLSNHHDIALCENPNLPKPPEKFKLFGAPLAVNHIAITLANRDEWLKQLAYLQSKNIKFESRIDHGMTHSLYIQDPNGYGVELLYELPRKIWEEDIDSALNYSKQLPTEGPKALKDETTDIPIFKNPTR